VKDSQVHVAVVGAGPSGLYAAEALVHEAGAHVDVIDQLPTPFGLVRYGVAPDHFSIRSVRDKLNEVFGLPNVRFIGNVTVGTDISVAELLEAYDAVVLTYGASRDRVMGIPGEELPGSIAATDFVAWYCGHPDRDPQDYPALLHSARSAVVVGVGNVAVDVTRILAKNQEELAATDMPDHVLTSLGKSGILDIHVLGRRSPAFATFTTKELKELGELADADVIVNPEALVLDEASQHRIDSDKVAARNFHVIQEWAQRPPGSKSRRIHLHFLSRPVEIHGTTHVERVSVERTTMTGDGRACGTGDVFEIPAEVVVRSIGYRGTGLPGVPFDAQTNVIPHVDGRVQQGGAAIPGLYVSGWIKRGPTGIIGTNKKDAVNTVQSLLADVAAGIVGTGGKQGIEAWPSAVVDTSGWERIDAAERSRGAARGRERTTIHDRDELLRIARA
jgi:ferredoxin/flavodoxin---NADP+ reductase